MKKPFVLTTLLTLLYSPSAISQETGPTPVAGLRIPLDTHPVVFDTVASEDGKEFPLAYRKPVGDGPFPSVIFFGGGTGTKSIASMERALTTAPTPTRFLNKGYLVASATRRKTVRLKTENPVSYSGGIVHDGIAAVKKTKSLLGVDPESIVIFGGSVGGALAIETAAQTSVAAVVVGEPSTQVWMTADVEKGRDIANFNDFKEFYTPEVKGHARSVLERIQCPILMLHGDPSGLRRTDLLFVMAKLVDLQKQAKSIGYAGYTHGFYFGIGRRQMTDWELDIVIEDAHNFVLPHLKTKPKPLSLSLSLSLSRD